MKPIILYVRDSDKDSDIIISKRDFQDIVNQVYDAGLHDASGRMQGAEKCNLIPGKKTLLENGKNE